MTRIITEFKSTAPNPDEEHLKTLWQAEMKNFEMSLAEEKEILNRRKANTLPLIKAAGFSEEKINQILREDKALSKKSLEKAERKVAEPPINFKVFHEQDLRLVKANAERNTEHNPSWSGCLFNANYGGWWWDYNGETEERPSVNINVGAERIDT